MLLFYPPRDLYQGKALGAMPIPDAVFYPPRDLYQGKARGH